MIGGGSGGHLFPAIAVAQEILLAHPEASVLFLTSRRPIDLKVLAATGWPTVTNATPAGSAAVSNNAATVAVEPYVSIPGSSGTLLRIALLPGVSRAYLRAKRRLKRFNPHVVIGCGAMASLPGVYAAHRLRIPIVLMEQNVMPGQAIRMLSRYARLTQTGLPLLQRYAVKWPTDLLVTGTPVRPSIAALARTDAVTATGNTRPRLLILGGSQGSSTVNRLTLEALADERFLPSDWQIVHQTGEVHVGEVAAEYSRRGRMASVMSFLPDLPAQLASATIAISRAGAGTLQELACAGVPSILIPFSRAANDHQTSNASLLTASGAAKSLDETQPDAGIQLRRQLQELIQKPDLRTELTTRIREFAHPEAAKLIANRVLQIAGMPSG